MSLADWYDRDDNEDPEPELTDYHGRPIYMVPDNAPLDDLHFAAYTDALASLNNAPAEIFYHFGDMVRQFRNWFNRFGAAIMADTSFLSPKCADEDVWGEYGNQHNCDEPGLCMCLCHGPNAR